MEGRQRDRESLGRASQIVATRGRVYVARGRYVLIQVFTNELIEIDLLERCFAGRHYKHRSGYVWQLHRRVDVRQLIVDLGDYHDPKGDVRTRLAALMDY